MSDKSAVERFDISSCGDRNCDPLVLSDDGVYVEYVEYEALLAEIERLRTAEGAAMTYKAGMENVAQQRDEIKKSLDAIDKELRGKVNDPDPLRPIFPGAASFTTTYGLVAGIRRERDQLKAELKRQSLQFKEWQASHHANYVQVADERDELKAENERLRKGADRWKWLEGSADSATWEQIGYQEQMNRHLHVDAAMGKGEQ
jgi:hypothetical protein